METEWQAKSVADLQAKNVLLVDFDPVRAKTEGRQPPGLDPATAALFPDSFEDSAMGKIPRGWAAEPIGQHAEAARRLSYKGSGLCDSGVPMHNLNSVFEGGGYKYDGIKFYNGEYRDRHVIKAGDVIVTNTEQGHDLLLIGYPAIAPKRFGEWGLFTQYLYRVRPRPTSPLTSRYIYLILMTPMLRDEITGHTNGMTVNMLAVSGLEMPKIAVPSPALAKRFDALVKPLFEKMEQLQDESPRLAATRDALLPKLLSGEIGTLNLSDSPRGMT